MNACLHPHSSVPQSTPHPSLAQTIMGQELPQPHPYFPSISYFLATQQHPALVFLHNIVLHYSPLRLSNQKHPLIASAQEFGARFIVLYTIVFTKQVHAISRITLHGQYTFCTTKQLNCRSNRLNYLITSLLQTWLSLFSSSCSSKSAFQVPTTSRKTKEQKQLLQTSIW